MKPRFAVARFLTLSFTLSLAGVIILGSPTEVSAAAVWQASASPTSIAAGIQSDVKVAVSLQSLIVTDRAGCIVVAAHPAFGVSAATITAVPPGKSWQVVPPVTSGQVRITAASSADRLGSLIGSESLAVAITVLGSAGGSYAWSVTAYTGTDCTGSIGMRTVTIGITSSVTPTPAPIPSATPTTAPTPTAAPSPQPSRTLGPTLQPTSGPTPRPTDTAEPSPAPARSPDNSSAPNATATSSSMPGQTGGSGGTIGGPSAPPAGSPPQVPVAPAFDIPATFGNLGDRGDLNLAAAALGGLGLLTWAVPITALVLPGFLIVLLAILAQAGGGLVWLPLVRRRIEARSARDRSGGSARR